jgi:ActR/RegA family two-component response regulator
MPRPTQVLSVVDDLFFVVKINDAARRAGLTPLPAKSAAEIIEKARVEKPVMVIVDLNAGSVNAVELITVLKQAPEMKGVSIIGFVSHIQGDLKQQAQLAGASMVMARSAFSTNLPQILRRHASSSY